MSLDGCSSRLAFLIHPAGDTFDMRKLVVTENMTLDGVIDLAAGWFDPLAEDVDQSDINSATTEHRQAADALLVGRNTFEAFREFWPKQTDDPTGISDYLNTVNKYVVSGTLDDPGWGTQPSCAAPSSRKSRSSRSQTAMTSLRLGASSSCTR